MQEHANSVDALVGDPDEAARILTVPGTTLDAGVNTAQTTSVHAVSDMGAPQQHGLQPGQSSRSENRILGAIII